jgi:DNA primase
MENLELAWEFIHSSLQYVHEFGFNAERAGSFGVGEWDK